MVSEHPLGEEITASDTVGGLESSNHEQIIEMTEEIIKTVTSLTITKVQAAATAKNKALQQLDTLLTKIKNMNEQAPSTTNIDIDKRLTSIEAELQNIHETVKSKKDLGASRLYITHPSAQIEHEPREETILGKRQETARTIRSHTHNNRCKHGNQRRN